MKKFLLVIAVLVMSATAFAADTLTTFADMESTYVYNGVRYVWGWKVWGGSYPYLIKADSLRFVSPSHSLMLQGITSNLSQTKNILGVPAVHGPGTYRVHLNVKVKKMPWTAGITLSSYTWVRGFCADSGGITTWRVNRRDTIPGFDTLWHTLDRDLMTITLAAGDSFRVRDTLSSITLGCQITARFDTLFVDDAYLTGTFTLNGVEEGPAKPKSAVHVSGLRPGIYDLLGRRVDQMEHSGIYFVVGRDGSRTKVVHLR